MPANKQLVDVHGPAFYGLEYVLDPKATQSRRNDLQRTYRLV